MAKNNQKCVRMSDEVLKIVEKFPTGEGFNEKFENLVIAFEKSAPEREAYIKNLDQQIESRKKKLNDVEKRIQGLENLEFSLNQLRNDILRINKQAESVTIVSQDEEPVIRIRKAAAK